MAEHQHTVILVPHNGMGSGDVALQHKLMAKYLSLLADKEPLPAAICLYADGVRLVVNGSPVVELLRKIASQGVRLIVCQTCLDHFGLTGEVAVGTVGGMADIIDAQWSAGKVITL